LRRLARDVILRRLIFVACNWPCCAFDRVPTHHNTGIVFPAIVKEGIFGRRVLQDDGNKVLRGFDRAT
jgi:hypothetical protein